MANNTITITDYSQENTSFGFVSSALTAGNIAGQTTALGALATATEALIIGHLSKQQVAQVLVDDYSVPTNPFAQRELKWLVSYQSLTSGKLWSLEIGTPDLGNDNIIPGTDSADLTSDAWSAWVSAFVSVAKAPDDITDSVIVLGAKLVGRNI